MTAQTQLLAGQRFGRLTVMGQARTTVGRAGWLCRCDCGAVTLVPAADLGAGKTQSCGCGMGKFTHGLSRDKDGKHAALYRVWIQMRQRCDNETNPCYANYGGRGIRVCEEWADYAVFHGWAMANGYRRGLSIERIDNYAGYNPANCTWIPLAMQPKNLRNNRHITFEGATRNLREWGRATGIDARTIASRVDRGWSIERALTAPVMRAAVMGVATHG